MTFILVRICKTNKRKSLSGLSEFYFSHCEVKFNLEHFYSDHLKKNAMVMNKDFSDVILVTDTQNKCGFNIMLIVVCLQLVTDQNF